MRAVHVASGGKDRRDYKDHRDTRDANARRSNLAVPLWISGISGDLGISGGSRGSRDLGVRSSFVIWRVPAAGIRDRDRGGPVVHKPWLHRDKLGGGRHGGEYDASRSKSPHEAGLHAPRYGHVCTGHAPVAEPQPSVQPERGHSHAQTLCPFFGVLYLTRVLARVTISARFGTPAS